MSIKTKAVRIIICDDSAFTRRAFADVLTAAGFERIAYASDGEALLRQTVELQPQIVITSSRIPNLSGLEYTRLIRAGYETASRTTSIIITSDTPTQTFLKAARDSGVDEVLARPFSGAALLARVEAVLLRPRRFVESVDYVGPCRRRRMLEDYGGPLRRFTDPFEDDDRPLWEAETNRELVRSCVTKISELARNLSSSDRRKLREIYAATADAEQLADDTCDEAMGAAARSLSRYIGAVGATGLVDVEVLGTHINAMQTLCLLGSNQLAERDELVRGLEAVVDKRLRRKRGAAA
jgi:DNA-binding response OmpR family regulator